MNEEFVLKHREWNDTIADLLDYQCDLDLKNILESCDYDQVKAKREDKNRIRDLQKVCAKLDSRKMSSRAFRRKSSYKIDYKHELNREQLAAVSLMEKPCLVIAGAGSGKTRVIVYKVAYLIENGVPANNILLLTFTSKAADEMLNRVNMLLGKRSNNVLGGTFHSFANYTLRKYGMLAGIRPNFTIMDAKDAEDTLSMIKDECEFKKRSKPFPPKKTLREIISKSRNMQISINKVVCKYFFKYKYFISEITQLNNEFQVYKKKQNIFDYDDLMDVLQDSMRDNELFRKKIYRDVKYVLVDEYQDTNNIQREVSELLIGDKKTITVVGDDAQSIYSFRGANYENILRFPQYFPDCEVVKVEQNYRSGQKILDFTNEIVSNAQIGFKKKLYTRRYTGKKPVIKNFADDVTEADFIADSIISIRANDLYYSDFAVLTRNSRQSDSVEAEFVKRGIPYIVVGGIKFNERRHIRDVIAFLKILLNPIDAVAWHRVLKLVGGIGDVRASEIVEAIKANRGLVDFSTFKDRNYYTEIKKYEKFYRKADIETPPSQLIKDILKFYRSLLKQVESDKYKDSLKDVKVLTDIASKYDNLEKFLSDFALEPPNRWQDKNVPQEGEEEKGVTISTIHSAKGLEWHTVFIPHALDGMIPSTKSLNSFAELEEERRVFYVAASRAKENLFITMPAYVYSYDGVLDKPSRFIKEINENCYDTEKKR